MKRKSLDYSDKIWYFLLIICQFLDAIFTYIGVKFLGHGILIEGNPLIRWCMENFGIANSLIYSKLFALSIITLLYINCVNKIYIAPLTLIYVVVVLMWVVAFVIV